ncbi:MAG: hypothetical protein K2G88_09475 [Oscillospiraceae bacterium]|nr:hypothetical protein [Oscillospiraceae bacterium]
MKSISIDELKRLKVWCNWRWTVTKKGKQTKAPLQKVNFPARWLTFGQAESYAKSGNLNGGIGLMFAVFKDNYAICGVDIDAHQVEVNPLAKEILTMFDGTYIEKSPSGKGYHILFLVDKSKLPDKKVYEEKYSYKNGISDIECYVAGYTNRYFTFTGWQQTDEDFLTDKTDALLLYLEKYMKKPEHVADERQLELTEGREKGFAPVSTGKIDVHQRLQIAIQAKNGERFSSLWNGDTSGYPSTSEAVQALINILVFYFGDGGEQFVKDVFLQSGLAVGKWQTRSDIIETTIKNGFARVHKRYTPKNKRNSPTFKKASEKNENSQREEKRKNFTGKEPLENYFQFEEYIESVGYSIRYNKITHGFEYFGFDSGESQEHLAENVPSILKDELKEKYSKVIKQDVIDYITRYATRHSFNPVLELIQPVVWDGKDRLEEIYTMFKIPSDTEDGYFSRVFIKKCLMQCLCGLYNDIRKPFPLDYVLVFQGKQGIGKTSFFKKLALGSEFFGDGFCLDPRDKDSIIQATSKWICELGEIGSTMKKDMDSVRAFISRSTDEYRTPYGKASLRYPRITTFVGTVNDSEYLIDETGNRRFLTVPIAPEVKLNYQTQIKPFDSLQLWSQIHQVIKDKDKSSCFKLTEEEERYLDKRNSNFMKPMKAECEILDILEEQQTPEQGYTCTFEEMTILDFIRRHSLHYDARTVGKVLLKHGYEPIQKRIGGKPTRLRRLPVKKSNNNSWGY